MDTVKSKTMLKPLSANAPFPYSLNGCFSRFLKCTNGTKLRNASQIIIFFIVCFSISYFFYLLFLFAQIKSKSNESSDWNQQTCALGYQPSSKTPLPLFLAKPPLKSGNCPNPLLFRQSPTSILIFHDPTRWKSDFSVSAQNVKVSHP